MKQRKFQIDFGTGVGGRDSGGEYTLGEVSQDFASEWYDIQETLKDHILAISREDFASEDYWDNSPLITDECEEKEEQPIWYDINDLEHISGIYFLGSAYVVEFGDDGNQIPDTEIEIDPHILHTRQTGIDEFEEPAVYWEDFDPDEYSADDPTADPNVVWQPVLEFRSSEKGQFHEWIVETDGEDFDPHKLVIALVHIKSMGGDRYVEAVFYDEKEVEAEDISSTDGNFTDVNVGWANITDRKRIGEVTGKGGWFLMREIREQNYENSWSDCRESIATSISGGETRIKS
tara:strand:+ start:106 stop:975 length:870 start_codon:yes stop_codon:yes gene_type:complete